MKKRRPLTTIVIVLALSLPTVAFAAGPAVAPGTTANPSPAAGQATSPNPGPAAPKAERGALGILFSAKNLLALGGYEDGYMAGAGLKYWIHPNFAARALVGIEHNTPLNTSNSTTTIGLGLAGEWHPSRGEASPYVGALAGMRTLGRPGQQTAADFYFGGLFGAEVKLLSSISAFVEYDLLLSMDSNGFSLNLGTDGSGGGRVLIGLIVYF